ncbi:MAG TPA: hypothetical protein VN679_15410 [Candidatus Acidoferrales bacterium]|jgi:hypothetical protein|nr:hypothetical protein [Candidatus Acidoferrales bacterium]
MAYEEGKVYLRDMRNGNIYPYERYLAADKNFEPCVPNQVEHTDGTTLEQEAPSA